MRIGFLVGGLSLAVLVILVVQYGSEWFAEQPAEPEVVVTPIEIPELQVPVVIPVLL